MKKDVEQQAVTELIVRNFDLTETDSEVETLAKVRRLLVEKLNFLLDHDFEKLLWILYRIDVSEEKAKQALTQKSNKLPAEILADLIIERQIEKVKTRLKYGSNQMNK